MNRLERDADFTDMLLAALRGWQSGLFTSDIGIINSYDPAKQTCTVQLATQQKIRKPDASEEWVSLPLLVDVPVHFPTGGGFTLTFPVKQGDECLVVFAQRCIDSWYQSGGVQVQAELRMHDISDGVAFVGLRSQPRVLDPSADADNVQLRRDDGSAFIEMTSAGRINIKAPGGLYINDKRVDETHTHSGVSTGGGISGAVV